MDRSRRDIVIRCDHGRKKDFDVVQRFRWVESQAQWVPTRNSTTRQRLLLGNSDLWSTAAHGEPTRVHLETACRCRNSVSADEHSLLEVFAMLCQWSESENQPNPCGRGFREAVATLVMTSNDKSVHITLDALRHALKLRRQLMNPKGR